MNEGSRPTVTSNPREPGSSPSTGLEKKTNHDGRRVPIDPRDPPRLRAVPRGASPRLGTPPVLPHVFIPTTYSNADVTSLSPTSIPVAGRTRRERPGHVIAPAPYQGHEAHAGLTRDDREVHQTRQAHTVR